MSVLTTADKMYLSDIQERGEGSFIDIAAGVVLFTAAAFFSISLLVRALDFGTFSYAHNTAFFSFGSFLYGTYGFSSILIPLFVLASGILCFSQRWTKKRGVYLVCSVVPFLTLAVTERLCRKFAQEDTGTLLGIKIAIALFICALVIAIEYLAAGIIADIRVKKTASEARKPRETRKSRGTIDDTITLPEIDDIQTAAKTAVPYAEPLAVAGNPIAFPPATDSVTDTDSQRTVDSSPAPESPAPEFQEFINVTEADLLKDTFVEKTPPSDEADDTADAVYTNLLETAEAILKDEGFDPRETEFAVEQFVETVLGDAEKPQERQEAPEQEQQPEPLSVTPESPPDNQPSVPEFEMILSGEDDFLEQFVETRLEDEEKQDEPIEQEIEAFIQAPPVVVADEFAEYNDGIKTETLLIEEDKSFGIAERQIEETKAEKPLVKEDNPFSIAAEQTEEKKTIKPLIEKVYSVPAEGLLTSYPDGKYWVIDAETERAATLLQETLNEFSIQADVTGIKKGPVITMFEILPAPGVKLSRIVSLQDNIALRLAASSVRIVAPIPGKHAVGIEVPNKKRAIVSFREIIETGDAQFKKMTIPAVLGKDITGEAQIIDLAKTPHMLIAGSTGSGKSVCVNSLILSILYTRAPAEVKMILIDPKIVELKLYNDIPHLLTPVITEPKRAFQALQYCLCEMERRYALLDGMGVRDIISYNQRIVERKIAAEKLPSVIIIIDEFADLMATTGKELESTVARLAAMSRAVGIHLVLATQRPSIDVITGLIKANIPTRIAFMVASKTDSRIIIDQVGAEKLLGKGDMLYSSAADPFPVRIQGTFVSDNEVESVADYVKRLGDPEYIDDEIFVDDEEDDINTEVFGDGPDPLYDKALEIVVQAGKASASYVQRRLKIGYNRAARLIEEMEHRGIVGPANGSKPRDIIHLP